jgi:hypothetical protein
VFELSTSVAVVPARVVGKLVDEVDFVVVAKLAPNALTSSSGATVESALHGFEAGLQKTLASVA